MRPTSLYNWCLVFSLMSGLLLDLAVLIFYFHKNPVICSLCLIYLKICLENDKFRKYSLDLEERESNDQENE